MNKKFHSWIELLTSDWCAITDRFCSNDMETLNIKFINVGVSKIEEQITILMKYIEVHFENKHIDWTFKSTGITCSV